MSVLDMLALSPLLLIAGTTILVLLIVAANRNHRLTVIWTLLGLTTAVIALAVAASVAPRQITPLLLIDQYAVFYTGLLFIATFLIVLFSVRYQEKRNIIREEYYILLLLATLGAALLVSSTHFVSFLLGLEILSVALYALIAYQRETYQGIEGGIKYLVMAGVSSAFLLFGMALVYLEQGTMAFSHLATSTNMGALSAAGLAMILVGVSFKLALAPFHFWAPDVYEGAPVPIAAFLATVSKGAIFALVLRYFSQTGFRDGSALTIVFTLLAVLSMFTGNLLALCQRNIKRLLAYSSIAHMGYALVAFLAGGAVAATVVTFYLVTYFITTLGAFGVIAELSDADHNAAALDEYNGLAWRRPWLAAAFSAMLLSLAGIPLTAGFIGKFLLLTAGVGANRWALVIILIINSTIGLYYYLRVITALYRQPDETEGGAATGTGTRSSARISLLGSGALSVLLLFLIWFGVYPAPLMRVIQGAVSQWFNMPR